MATIPQGSNAGCYHQSLFTLSPLYPKMAQSVAGPGGDLKASVTYDDLRFNDASTMRVLCVKMVNSLV